VERGPEGPENPLLPLRGYRNVVLALPSHRRQRRHGHMDGSYLPYEGGRALRERISSLLCTPERQSLFESHRQRRWLTRWS